MDDVAVLVLRVVVGIIMICHGVPKFQMTSVFDEKWREDYGFPRGSVVLTGIVQVAGGEAIAAGVFGRLVALILLLVTLMATYVSIGMHSEPFLSTPGISTFVDRITAGVGVSG